MGIPLLSCRRSELRRGQRARVAGGFGFRCGICHAQIRGRGVACMKKFVHFAALGVKALDFLAPLVDLAVRVYVANVFWKSGLVKITSWQSTLFQFESEYHVPLLSPAIAA